MPIPVRKIVITSASSDPSVVQIVDDVLADPIKDEVQIKVLHSGFSTTDINMRLGAYPGQRKAPFTPGYCLVGRVYQSGPSCCRFNTGDLVAALTVYDGEATYANVAEKYLMALPESIDLAKACALVVDWTTAWGMVKRAAKVQKGDRVFIHGMSGAVGLALMSLCLSKGATVYGTASQRNHEHIRNLGGIPFVYTNKYWIDEMKKLEVEGSGLTAVFDPLGFESWDESYSVLSQKASSVLVGYGGNLETFNSSSESKSRSVVWPVTKLLSRNLTLCKRSTKFFYIDRDQKTFVPEFEELVSMLQDGSVDVQIKRVITLDEIPQAHQDWMKMPGMGSVVVKIGEQ